MNTEELFKRFKKSMIISEKNDGDNDWVIFGIPYFHLGHPESVAIKLTRKNGELIVSDVHTTTDYLYADHIDLDDYSEKLEKIMSIFNIYRDGEVFRMVIHNQENPFREIGYFMEAMSLIAHIDL